MRTASRNYPAVQPCEWQYNIAWNAYERAVELKASFWPEPAIQQAMVEYCRSRQKDLASSKLSDSESSMRKQHQDELAWGLAYQKAYQDYEANQITAGLAQDDPHFYDGFFNGRPPIASNPGLADDLVVSHKGAATLLPCILLGLGFGMAVALVVPEKHRS